MYSINEWGQLKKVVVGIADYARIPNLDISLRCVNYANINDIASIPGGPYPDQVIEQANEDLKILSTFLSNQGITVVRPNKQPTAYYNYCPRDTVMIYGNQAIVAPMSLHCRENEYLSYADCLENIHVVPNVQSDDLYNLNCIGDPNILALTEKFPKFDAANIIRANEYLLYLVSNSGNRKGAEYLQNYFPDCKVRVLEGVYSYMHIDSTIAFLREGLMLCNPSRIKSKDVLPDPFNKWEIIWAPEPIDIGYYPGYCNASKWLSINLISINSNLVVLEEHQENLRIILERKGIDCAMLPMRHSRTLGGCFHCVTLDLEREIT